MDRNKLLDGKKLALELNQNLKLEIEAAVKQTGVKPKLATILVGEDPASQIYVNIKHKTCASLGIESLMVSLDESISKENLIKEIEKLNNDKTVHGILLQLPLPNKLRKYTEKFIETILFSKDVDGFHPINRGKLFDYDEDLAACTPKGIISLIEHYNISLKGKEIVIINRSNLVGKPLFFMFLKRNATPTICHTSTRDIDFHTKRADILVVAAGTPKLITKDKIKDGAIIIDVGTNRLEGKLVGDVDFDDVYSKCGMITPVPGGIGPLTVSSLLNNTVRAYKKQLNIN